MENTSDNTHQHGIEWVKSEVLEPRESGKLLVFFEEEVHVAVFSAKERTVEIPLREMMWDFSDNEDENWDRLAFKDVFTHWCSCNMPSA